MEEPKKQVNRIFINEKLSIKVVIDYRTTMTYKLRTTLEFKQYDVILTKESVLTKIMSSFKGRNIHTQYKIILVIWLTYIFVTITLQ